MQLKKTIVDQERVYEADGSGDFCNVQVSLDITEREEIITLRPQQNMTFSEVERVLHEFETDVLKKMQMQLEGSYPARLEYKGKTFKIAFDDNRNVKGILPL